MSIPLIVAAQQGKLDEVESLLGQKAELNQAGFDKKSALIHAAKKGHVDVVRCLLNAKAAANWCDRDDNTALVAAARGNHVACIQALAQGGANLDQQCGYGSTALIKATIKGHCQAIQTLAALKANVNAKSENGNNAIMLAAFWQTAEVIETLLQCGAEKDPNALRIAKDEKKPELAKLLDTHEQNGGTAYNSKNFHQAVYHFFRHQHENLGGRDYPNLRVARNLTKDHKPKYIGLYDFIRKAQEDGNLPQSWAECDEAFLDSLRVSEEVEGETQEGDGMPDGEVGGDEVESPGGEGQEDTNS